MPPPRPTVAVIGAGISGLTATKMLVDYGVPVTCFEASDRVGGNWAFGNPNGHSSAYVSLHIDTSKHQLSFRDLPMPEHYPDFPHHTLIKEYLDHYADTFELRDHIEFENRVVRAHRLPDGGWEITDQAGAVRRFDLLVVANGHHWDPRTAEFPGEFTGESIHSHHYIDPWTPLNLMDKRILVVGLGNSAADVTVELSQRVFRNQVTLSTRSSAWIVPKLMFGKAADMNYRTNPHLPLAWQRKVAQWGQRFTASDPTLYGLPAPNHKFFEAHPTQSGELPLRLKSGDVTPKGNVSRLDGSTVHFEDGTSADFDVIVYATGYNLTFPFFDPEFLDAPDNRIDLYRRIFKPGVDDLLFAGFAQATPTLFPFVECQARLIAAYAIGEYAPPPVAEMLEEIKADDEKYMGHMLDRPRHTHQLDYFVYEHQLRTQELPQGLAAGGEGVVKVGTPRGDERRTALLEALDHHLRESSLESINIADISRRAGVTRSAFYFYFDNKASAVAALMEEMYDESLVAADLLRGEGTPAERVEAMVRGLFGAWERHEHLYRAMYDARATSSTVRELWDSDRESFVPVVAGVIEAERAAGNAPPGADATHLASVLLELNDRMLERLALGGPLGRDELVDAVVTVWVHTIYGRVS